MCYLHGLVQDFGQPKNPRCIYYDIQEESVGSDIDGFSQQLLLWATSCPPMIFLAWKGHNKSLTIMCLLLLTINSRQQRFGLNRAEPRNRGLTT